MHQINVAKIFTLDKLNYSVTAVCEVLSLTKNHYGLIEVLGIKTRKTTVE